MERKLLAIGGDRVVFLPESYLDAILKRGQTFPSKRHKKVSGVKSSCHQNAALLYAKHHAHHFPGTCEIVCGYGLTEDDGLWRQHTWLWDGRRVIETTVSRTVYFGAILTPAEAFDFVFYEVMPPLPGWAEVSEETDERRKAA